MAHYLGDVAVMGLGVHTQSLRLGRTEYDLHASARGLFGAADHLTIRFVERGAQRISVVENKKRKFPAILARFV